MNLTQAAEVSGMSKPRLLEMIESGRLLATHPHGSRDWDINAESLAQVTGLPDVMTRQHKADEEIADLKRTVATLVAWQQETAATIAFLVSQVTGKHISRRQIAVWLGEHGFIVETWTQVKEMDRHIHHDRPINQQEDALVFALLRFRKYPGRFGDTSVHEDADPDCVCHKVIPDLYLPPTL